MKIVSMIQLRLTCGFAGDVAALTYTSLLGSAAAYGIFFYNASKGNLTKLSSLTFLTPVFACFAGFVVLSERLTPLQLLGAMITLAGVLLMNYKATKLS
jgi:drug/metabolite transporter (DMT)-like permease